MFGAAWTRAARRSQQRAIEGRCRRSPQTTQSQRRARSASSSRRDCPRSQGPHRGALIAPCAFDDMIDIEIFLLTPQQRPSDEGVAKTRFNPPAGETVRNLLAGIGVEVSGIFVYSLAPIGEDVDFEGAAVTLDDVVTRSSRLFVRPRVDGADSAVVFMYVADGDDFVPVGAVDLNQEGAQAALSAAKIDCYDCVLRLAKEFCTIATTAERSKAAALHLLNSKPSRKDLEFFALSKYSPALLGPTIFDKCLKSSRRYWARVDASAKFLEVIEPLRGRRACHVIFSGGRVAPVSAPRSPLRLAALPKSFPPSPRGRRARSYISPTSNARRWRRRACLPARSRAHGVTGSKPFVRAPSLRFPRRRENAPICGPS